MASGDLKLGLNLGYWGIGPAGNDALEVVKAAEAAGFESVWAAESYGSDVVSVLAWLAGQTTTIKLGAAILQVPGAPAGRRGDGRGDDRQALRRPLPLRLRPLRPAGLRGLVRRALREALGADPRVHRSRARDHRPRGPGRPPGRALPAAAARRRGQGAEAQLPSRAQRDPGLRRRDRPQIGRDGGRDLRRLDPDLLLGRRLRGDLGRAPGGGLREGRPPALRPRGLALAAGRDRRRPGGGEERRQGRPRPLLRRHGQPQDELLRRPRPPLRLRRRRRRGPEPLPGRRPRRRLRGAPRRDRRGDLAGRHRGTRSPSGSSASAAPGSTA